MIIPLQHLRGAAALMVVYHHIAFQLGKTESSIHLPLASTGAAGVDIFFVISGFVIWVSTRSSSLTPAAFLRRRLVRIVPLYWAVTITLLIVAALAPGFLDTTRFEPEHAALSLLFIPATHPQLEPHILPYFIQGWTLNYEMFFYALFALALAVSRSMTLPLVIGALGLFALSGLMLPPRIPALGFYATTLLGEFAAGMALGALYLSRPEARPFLAALLIGTGMALLYLTDTAGVAFGPDGTRPERALLWGVPSLAIVAGTIFLSSRGGRNGAGLLWTLGAASYSLYLTHLLTLPVTRFIWLRTGLGFDGGEGLAFVMAAMCLSIAVAIFVFLGFERPAMAFLNDPLSRLRAKPASV